MRLFARLFGPVLLAMVIAACGEDIDFASGRDAAAPVMAPDAAPPVVDASLESSVHLPSRPDAAVVDAARGAHHFPDAGCPSPVPMCAANGSFCQHAYDCCTGRCDQGYCLPSGTCAAPGAACNTRTGCCSNRCEPSNRTGALECAQYCMANGAPCRDASDCCSFGCNGGTCGGPLCSTAGSPCSSDATCCSGHCGPSGCAPTMGACLPTEEACDQDSGMKCCSNFCNARTGRCDLGAGGCREQSSPCNSDSDCCRPSCLRNPQDPRGASICAAPCLADGIGCNSNGDCCGGVCTGMPTVCETPSPFCP